MLPEAPKLSYNPSPPTSKPIKQIYNLKANWEFSDTFATINVYHNVMVQQMIDKSSTYITKSCEVKATCWFLMENPSIGCTYLTFARHLSFVSSSVSRSILLMHRQDHSAQIAICEILKNINELQPRNSHSTVKAFSRYYQKLGTFYSMHTIIKKNGLTPKSDV